MKIVRLVCLEEGCRAIFFEPAGTKCPKCGTDNILNTVNYSGWGYDKPPDESK